MLFSLRQSNREGKQADEELLGSAVQACWELCDLFREGWTQIRPERGTPRPSQTSFNQSPTYVKRQSNLMTVPEQSNTVPETPTTIFDDNPLSPEEQSPSVPNILVLGSDTRQRWSTTSSTLSGYSQTSNKTSSTATTATAEDLSLVRLKALIVKAAMNAGYQRNTAQPLPNFVKMLPTNAFGAQPWQMSLLENFKKLVLHDTAFRAPASLPSTRVTAAEVARAVQWMMRSGQYGFLRDLYRLVFGFHIEEGELRKGLVIQT
jgi:hypothetical protein